jgi:hypothetical protein
MATILALVVYEGLYHNHLFRLQHAWCVVAIARWLLHPFLLRDAISCTYCHHFYVVVILAIVVATGIGLLQ